MAKLEQTGPFTPPLEATINIRNLRLRTLIGFNPEEREKRQVVLINIETWYRFHSGTRRPRPVH